RRMAIFVPLWKEHRVIRRMVEHNIATQKYRNYDFFIGAYPNDAPTVAAITELEQRFANVHIAQCPHEGPTSKADCLNWIYQRMLLFEEEHATRFEMVLTHDAEDIIHPEALHWTNYYAQWNDMVQIPVLALPTAWRELTHGVYCDEFAQFQLRDMPVRNMLGGFVPSNGVGTGFSRNAIEKLATAFSNRIFEPTCLTEDYENGFRVNRLGCRQIFVPLQRCGTSFVATREYFPKKFRTAVRQRTRWSMGIALQSWEHHGWRETLSQAYWFWRDRKNLLNNLLTPFLHLLFLYGAATFVWSWHAHEPWGLGKQIHTRLPAAAGVVLAALTAAHMAIRAGCAARIYGVRFAAFAPLRTLWGSWINFLAAASAIGCYGLAKLRGKPLVWLKTEHTYPNRSALRDDAISLDLNLPLGKPASVSRGATRAIPAAVARKWRVLPFKIAAGHLHVVGSEPPTDEMQAELKRFSSFEIRFQLVTPADFAELAQEYLPAGDQTASET
ncbi:MAG: bacteriophage receptor, outer membrane protein, partial [Bryobacterales bacterium]|nr:bacteriophage receptor, outer membrane protein [Bryobacterales bacterium]